MSFHILFSPLRSSYVVIWKINCLFEKAVIMTRFDLKSTLKWSRDYQVKAPCALNRPAIFSAFRNSSEISVGTHPVQHFINVVVIKLQFWVDPISKMIQKSNHFQDASKLFYIGIADMAIPFDLFKRAALKEKKRLLCPNINCSCLTYKFCISFTLIAFSPKYRF